MILGELLSRPVRCQGEDVGVVIDARFLLRDPDRPGRTPPELVGLIVGPRRGAAFLGYERADVVRPKPLNGWFARRQRGSFLVDVDDIDHLGETVELRPGFTRWSVQLPPHGGESA